ncbi:hypothetical protein DENSPDRAFT_845380 [Dentipellis sp. KUC8613]|nr:hypothetical protein DENSPDRAFT_845380 [Dentipellis sp. KUC8613]
MMVIAPTLIIVRVGMGEGFDRVVETSHLSHNAQVTRGSQLKSIKFADHGPIATDISHLASQGGPIEELFAPLQSSGDSIGGRSDRLETVRDVEKAETELNAV